MAHVYRAEHVDLGKEVALKVLAIHGKGFAERFEREARTVARLDHPGCVRILDYGHDDQDVPFMAMELLEGPTLAALLETDGQLSPRRAVAIARSLLAALAHAHGHGVIHRDVKPANVMLVGARVVLIDFGLACVRDAAALTAAGMCVGSPSYIAPERLLGRPYDARNDVYAVGVLLYEMLAGVRPFIGSTPEEIMQHVLDRPPRPLRACRPDVPRELEGLIARALSKDPARRFADAEQMLSALDDVRVDDPSPPVTAELPRREEVSTMIEIAVQRPSLFARVWSRLRYGRWRWRHA